MTSTQQPVRTRTKPIVIVALIALVATIAGLLVWGTRNTDEASAVDRQIESTVTSMITSYNEKDWQALSSKVCGDLAARLFTGKHGGPVVDSGDNEVLVKAADDFHYTTAQTGDTAYTFASLTLGIPSDPAGDVGPNVAFFALTRTGESWKVCTAQMISTQGAFPTS